MCHLAHWIYKNEELQMGVTEGQLTNETTQYLREFFEHEARARSYAQMIVDFFRGRAWVFSDTGSNENERLYQFTHRTFLEYFTAEYLVGSCRGPENLGAILLPYIEKREWDTVSQLAYQMQAKLYKEAADDLLDGLLQRSSLSADRKKSLNLILFAIRSLAIIHPKLEVRKRVVSSGLNLLIRNLEIRTGGGTAEENVLQGIGESIVSLRDESGRPIADMTVDLLKRYFENPSMAAEAMEVMHMLPSFLERNQNDQIGFREKVLYWQASIRKVSGEFSSLKKESCKENRSLALTCWWENELTFDELVGYQRALVVFASRQVAYRASHYISIACNLYWYLIGPADSHDRFSSIVRPLLDSLMTLPRPWKTLSLGNDFDRLSINIFQKSGDMEFIWPATPYARSAVALLSTIYGTINKSSKIAPGLLDLQALHHLRKENSKDEAAYAEITRLAEALDLIPAATEMMKMWARHEMDLIDQPTVSNEARTFEG
jgi:hypothetical protein